MDNDPKDTAAALKRIAETVKPTIQDDTIRRMQEELESGVADAQYEMLAKMFMVRYRTLIKAGFSDTQALYLIGK
jgi:hypothetical protein